MRVLIETVGSAGDVHPFVAIGRELTARGHEVTLFSNDHFRATIESSGLRFGSTSTAENYDEITSDPDLWHPTRGPAVVLGNTAKHLVAPTVDAMLAAADTAADAETIVVAPTLGFAGRCVAELTGAPFVRVHLQPTAFRSVHQAPRLPGLWMPEGAPAWWKRLLYRLSDVVIDRMVCPHLNAFRRSRGLPPVHRVFGDPVHEADALIALYPEWFAPPQPDAPRGLRHTGFARFDRGDVDALDDDIAAWMQDGSAPLLFTHGSANRHARRFFEASAAAARELGRRALLVTTEGSAVAGLTGADIRHATYAPFGQALRSAALFAHHGGVGTLAQGLAAGRPQLVVPMGFDQLDNAERVERLGVGRALGARRYDARSATDAVRSLLESADVADAARALAPEARVDGAPAAADIIESAASTPRARRAGP